MSESEAGLTFWVSELSVNGQPFNITEVQVTRVQSNNPKGFPDEGMMLVHQRHDEAAVAAVVFPCRVKGNNHIEVSTAVFDARVRSFIMDNDSFFEESALDLRHLPLPKAVAALVGETNRRYGAHLETEGNAGLAGCCEVVAAKVLGYETYVPRIGDAAQTGDHRVVSKPPDIDLKQSARLGNYIMAVVNRFSGEYFPGVPEDVASMEIVMVLANCIASIVAEAGCHDCRKRRAKAVQDLLRGVLPHVVDKPVYPGRCFHCRERKQ